MGIVSGLGGGLFSVGAEQLGDELERARRLVELCERVEDETIEHLGLFDARLPAREMFLYLIEVGGQVLQVAHLQRALRQMNEYCVPVFARQHQSVE